MTATKVLNLSLAEKKIIEILSSLIEERLFEATKLIIFGSRARGISNEESDLDIALIVKSSADSNMWNKLWAIKWEALDKLNLEEFPLSLIILPEEEFDSNYGLIEEIKKDGVIIWERN
ncbi:MAG: nucleotidyltransferase domain-containing protein [Thermodesulfovibrio sp.]|nr:nucleotidyltransferase domain-containing protein [Thermodesulfovibrio sp.]